MEERKEERKEGSRDSGPRNGRGRSSVFFPFSRFFLLYSFLFSFFYSSSPSPFSLSLHAARYLCFSLFAARRCVWSVVAAARVDSLITLSGPSGLPPTRLLLVLRAPTPPKEKGKKVPKIQSPGPQIVFYECLHVPVGPISKPLSYPFCHPPRTNVTRHPRSPSATSSAGREKHSISLARERGLPARKARNRCLTFHDIFFDHNQLLYVRVFFFICILCTKCIFFRISQ